MARTLQRTAPGVPPPCVRATPRPAWDAAGHVRRVDAITAAIAAGTIYQANLTLPFQAELHPGPHRDLAVFSALRRRAPGCYGALLRHGGCTVISHSPECFLRSDGRDCCSEPIKGTRRREPGREAAVRAQLLAAAKDNAELAMIVDLVRNDLGRVAVPGGVAVAAPATVIDLSYVHHLVATVTARLHATVGHADLLAAAFPAGSITGAPKIAAMELIRELESGPRGAYCGCFGWLGAHGACELAVAIRTMVVRGNSVRFDAGGGIVVDSGGADEWQEVLAKIGPMAAALTSGACA
ncbi:MAG: chorismate-binding protein [Planctomycetota bacterium]